MGTRKFVFWMITILVVALIGAIGYWYSSNTTVTLFGMTSPINWGRSIWIATAFYILLSIMFIPEAQVGCLIILGVPTLHVESGPAFVPWLISKVILFPGTYQQDELPSDPENIFRQEDKEGVPKGKFPPNRITFNRKPETGDPLDERITAEVPIVVVWKIDNAVSFVKTIGADPAVALQEARRQMNDTGIVAATAYFGKDKTVGEGIADLAGASEKVKEAIDMATASWGIDIPRAEVKSINLNHGLNGAMAKVPEEAYKAKARGLEGEGIANFAEKSGISPQDTMAVEVAKAFAGGENTTIIAGTAGMSEVLGMVATAARAFNNDKKKDGATT